jgi:hypothetical protein
LNDAYVVPSAGQSGGLWLLWKDEVEVTIIDHNHHFIFALCVIKSTNQQYGLICIYGDPHHHATNVIWDQVLNFVTSNNNLPMLCMGDLNELMHANEKLGQLLTSIALIIFVLMSNNVGSLISGIMARPTPGLTNVSLLFPLMKDLTAV